MPESSSSSSSAAPTSALLPASASPQLQPEPQASANGSLVSPPPHTLSDAWLASASQLATPSAHATNDTAPAGGGGSGVSGGGSKQVELVPLYCAVMGLVIVCVVIYAIWKQHSLRVRVLALAALCSGASCVERDEHYVCAACRSLSARRS